MFLFLSATNIVNVFFIFTGPWHPVMQFS